MLSLYILFKFNKIKKIKLLNIDGVNDDINENKSKNNIIIINEILLFIFSLFKIYKNIVENTET